MRHFIVLNKHLHYLHIFALSIILFWAFLTGIDYRAKTEVYEAHLSKLSNMSLAELGKIKATRG